MQLYTVGKIVLIEHSGSVPYGQVLLLVNNYFAILIQIETIW